jgi:predicted ATP-grasp superfamily ATP-dependent carboligase
VSELPGAFLTQGWCRVSYVILHSLAARGVPVHVGDHSGLAMCRYSARRRSFSRTANHYRDPERFVDDVARGLRRTGARVLLAGHEDVVVLSRFRDRLPPDTLFPAATAKQLGAALDKWEITQAAIQAGVSVPRSWQAKSWSELRECASHQAYPCVVKTRLGNSGKGVFVVQDPSELEARVRALVELLGLEPDRWPFVQDFAPGEGYGVCLLYDRGECRAVFSERYLRAKDGAFGTSVFRESVRAPFLEEQARQLVDTLDWHGVIHLDFLYDRGNSRSTLLEANPRFWGALDLAVRAGVDFPWLLYRMAVDGGVQRVEEYATGVRSRWIVGELLHAFNHARRGRLGATFDWCSKMLRQRADGHDDLRLSDPLPLLAELLYYGHGFLRSGSVNPVEEGMLG